MDSGALLEESTRLAQEFCQQYIHSLDNKHQGLDLLYREDASLVWNEQRASGKEAIRVFLSQLPELQHLVEDWSAQPALDVLPGIVGVLITVWGLMKIQREIVGQFQHVILLCPQNNSWYIMSDVLQVGTARS